MKRTLLICLLFVPFALLAQTPVARYTFNNGNAEDEVGTNDGVVSSATLTTDRFGNANMAYSFDGVDDYITLGDVSEFQFGTDDFAISIWVEYSVAQQGFIISKRDGVSSNYQQYNIVVMNSLYSGGNALTLWGFLRNSDSDDRFINAGNLAGAWNHIVLNHRHNDSTSVYVNGQFVGQSSNTYSTGTLDILGAPLVLGYASDGSTAFYTGKIDDIHIYRTALSEQQIDSLFTLPNPATLTVADENAHPAITVYPNPVADFMSVQMDQIADVTIYSSTGQLMNRFSGSSYYRLDVSNYPSGIYIIRSGATTHRFIKP